MKNQTKICFVIMGFGKKSDPDLGKTYDLDKTYKNIIRPAVTASGYECVRADEVLDSGLIDKSMYALLMQADLVVADITTFNPNAIYELGIRHGVRPYSTIILKEKNGKIPFDLDHNRMCMYSHLGEDIGVDEAERCKQHLIELITTVTEQNQVDSPLYEFINDIKPPILPKSEYVQLIDDLAEKEKLLFALVEKATQMMRSNNFEQAVKFWEKASNSSVSEPYFIQQWALSRYKSNPQDITALIDALTIISKLTPDNQSTNDPETLGITGAIYKNMWWVTKEASSLDRAIEYYGKCFKITDDYYNGENYALCLDEKALNTQHDEEETYCCYEAKQTRKRIIGNLTDLVEVGDFDNRLDKKWIYASLSNCYFALKDTTEASKYEQFFIKESPLDWEVDTFKKSKEVIKEIHYG
ncbi:TRAFs-binding domain-containing protein [Vibrio penaeicida]|uniref:TRAFs-binding domain-containing protein n=1 Tax=Vibrio penaeicida TaxID=104609 RepID=UPI000CEA5012|nr:TRAFs-binding domain-containing protein [Vibrio penaeicida]